MTRTGTKIMVAPRSAPNPGGVETHVAAVSDQLRAVGEHVLVVAAGSGQVALPFKHPDAAKWQVWRAVWQQRQLFRQAEIVHVHDVLWWLLPVWPWIKHKLFITFHGWEGQYPVPLKNKILRQLWSRLAVGSIHVGGWIQDFYGDKPDLVIDGGIDPGWLAQPIKPPPARPHFVFMGRLEPENDVALYIKLVKQLTQSRPDLRVTWVGDGSLRARCQRLGKVTGMVDDPAPFLKKATIVGAASYLSMLQAMALGKVVVALYSQPLKQAYLHTFSGAKYLHISNDITLTSQFVLDILNKRKNLVKWGQQARRFAETKTWSQVAKQYRKLWKKSQ